MSNRLPKELRLGRSNLENFSKARTSCVEADDNIICTVLGKYQLVVRRSDTHIVPHLINEGFWEAWITLAMARLLQPGWKCIDVGANFGYFTMLMADAVGANGDVIAVEPHPVIYDCLQRSVELNNFSNVTVLNKAAHMVSGHQLPLVTPANAFMNASLHIAPTSGEDVISVETMMLDEIYHQHGCIDFIKIDAEASELEIWNGMQFLLKHSPNLKIFLEVNNIRYQNPERFYRQFEKAGLQLSLVNYNGEIVPTTINYILTHEVGSDMILFLERPTPVEIKPRSDDKTTGLNFIADTTIDSGVGESARMTLDAIHDAKIPVSYIEFNYDWEPREVGALPNRYEDIKLGSRYDMNLFFYNINEFSRLDTHRLKDVTRDKYTITYWVWEQPSIPRRLQPEFTRVDEVWTASTFCQNALAKVRPIPVKVIPHPIQVSPSRRWTSHELGVPAGRMTFLFTFSAASCEARKNPLGLIEAFRKAFPPDMPDRPVLILKAHHLSQFPAYAIHLKQELASVGGVLHDKPLSRQEMTNLLASVDCYVSLHRAEGFGLAMAEAMALGKPVIATHYSGNVDFMNSENSFPVNYHLRPVQNSDFQFQPQMSEVYELGHLWAEPDLDHAAELMQLVYENPKLAQERGRKAAQYISDHLSPEVVSEVIRKRLDAINPAERNLIRYARHSDVVARRIPMKTDAPDMKHLLHEYTQAFSQWEAWRQAESHHRYNYLSGIGFLLRTLLRIRNLGNIWASLMQLLKVQQDLNTRLMEELKHKETIISSLNQQVSRLSHKIDQLNHDVMLNNHQINTLYQIQADAEDKNNLNGRLVVRQEYTYPRTLDTYNRIIKRDDFKQFGIAHRKAWEVQMALRTLRELGAASSTSQILGVGAGREQTIFELANSFDSHKVIATDLYNHAGDWESWHGRDFIDNPLKYIPHYADPLRISVQHADMRDLPFPNNSFDGIFSSGSIHHIGQPNIADWDAIAKAASEIGRVLKPGGIASLSTEWKIKGKGWGWGHVRLFTPELVQKYIVIPSGLELVDTPDWQFDGDLADAIDLRELEAKPYDNVYVIRNGDIVFTSVHLALRKPV